jgi:hypothetical protein
MLTRVVIKVPAIVAVTLLSAVAAMLVGVIGGCMVAGSVVLRRSDDVHLRLTVYPMRPDLETLDRQDGERGALWGLLVFVSAVIAGAIGLGLSSLP